MNTRHLIQIAKQTFLVDQQNSENTEWNEALSAAHLKDVTYCMCKGKIRLSVVCRKKEDGSSSYSLRKWPDTGLLHDIDCAFFGETGHRSSSADGSKSAIEELEDGKVRIFLATSLAATKRATAASESPSSSSGSRSSRQRAGNYGLLSTLWQQARLHTYSGKPRKWFSVCCSLLNALETVVIDRSGRTLEDVCLIASSSQDRMMSAHNQKVLNAAKGSPTDLVVIGEIRTNLPDKEKFYLPLKQFDSLPPILCDKATTDRLLKKRPLFENVRTDGLGHLICLAIIRFDGKKTWNTIDLAGLATSHQFVPAESSFEIEFDDYLAGQGRRYMKPMDIEQTEFGGERPDYYLLDCSTEVACEVWGMQTPEYLASKRVRLERYASQGRKVVSWVASPKTNFPELPSRNRA